MTDDREPDDPDDDTIIEIEDTDFVSPPAPKFERETGPADE